MGQGPSGNMTRGAGGGDLVNCARLSVDSPLATAAVVGI